jgi:hypothetical protein
MTASPYLPCTPRTVRSSDELRAAIPGWGVDLDHDDRPSVPRERFDPDASGAHWDLPDRQPQKWTRERSLEHLVLTPVFGTSCPPRGLSGAIRRLAYARYSEATAAHWLLLLAADRVDSKEAMLRSLLAGRPDNPVAETGVLSELGPHGLKSRRLAGGKRADSFHHWLDPVIVGGPWVIGLWLAGRVVKKVRTR